MPTSTSSDYMTANDHIVVKSRYLKPILPDSDIENMNKRTTKYKQKVRGKKCIMCNNQATQLLCHDIDGATFTQKYCDDCIKSEKHLSLDNFDNLFIKAESGNPNYDKLHARNPSH